MSAKPHDERLERELYGKEKAELIELILNLLTENRESKEKNQKLQELIDTKIVNNWTWDKINDEFMEITNLSKSLSFLRKILEEKSICTNNKCPAFSTLNNIQREILKFTREYKNILDPESAEIKYKNEQSKLNQWENDYWDLKMLLSDAFNEIYTIGVPNKTKKDNFFMVRNFLHDKHIEIMDKCDNVSMNIDPSGFIAPTLEADKESLSSEDFSDYGNDIFKEKRKELAEKARQETRKEQGKYCPKCGSKMMDHSKFCNKCGHEFKK